MITQPVSPPDSLTRLLECVDDLVDWLDYTVMCDAALWADLEKLKTLRMVYVVENERKRRAALLKEKVL